ncbi:MAG TPA: hypothetical protein VG125_27640 [Pirellulales bacterium]|jgi:hypothetical protein|nr:hypothetical protein [Pirellulales bacterium]
MDDASTIRDRTSRAAASPAVASRRRTAELCLIAAATVVALASARDFAGGWNDGSRLATVESLVDGHTLAIDDSIFVRSPATADEPNPYTPGDEALRTQGTKDKLLIRGHFYSDKSPLPAFWLAAWYKILQSSTGLVAREHPRLFCYLMAVVSSGMAYVVTVWSIWRLALRRGLPLTACVLLAASLALATIALPYTRHVNNHILLLEVVGLLMLTLDRLAELDDGGRGRRSVGLASAAAGTLVALGYGFDLGMGPVLLISTAALVTWRTRKPAAIACFALAALPWLAAHHAVNYLTGGTFGPANSVAEYLAWPGSPFSTRNMTGGWGHETMWHFLVYAAALLVGKHGFIDYNLPLWLAVGGLLMLGRRRGTVSPEIVFAAALTAGSWLLYAALSNNYSGPCCSIRWFVPLLVPAYYVLIVLLRERPVLVRDLALLSVPGAILCAGLWWRGPWEGKVPLALWPLNAAALIGWSLVGLRRRTSTACAAAAGRHAGTGRQAGATG